jgi:folate-binding protein YgfZ
VVAEERTLLRTRYTGDDGWDVIAAEDAVSSLEQSCIDAGAVRGDAATLDVLRIEAGSPRWGAELTDTTIPLEAGLRERAISETKGCYTGQEVIIRILHRGHVNRHLRGLLLGDAPAPSRGTELLRPDDQKKVGQVTSAVWSPTLGQAVALAYVRREVEPGTEVLLGSAAGPRATVVMLPWPEAVGSQGASDGGTPPRPAGSGSQHVADDLSRHGNAPQME